MTTRRPDAQPGRTVRELGGEFAAELSGGPVPELPLATHEAVIDLVMRVLARHCGSTIENDADFPVEPLPRRFPPDAAAFRVREGEDG